MAKTERAETACPMETGINLLSGRWRLKIIWHLLKGRVRFNELRRKLSPITTKTLARELDDLEGAGIISRTVYPEIPPRVEYAVTELGETIRPVLNELCAWGRLYEKQGTQEVSER